MNPVLIYTDTATATREKAFLTAIVANFQATYNAIAALNVTPSLSEINTLIGFTVRRNGTPNFVQQYVIDKLLDMAAPYTVNGVTLTRDAFEKMIAVPDVTNLISALNAAYNIFNRYGQNGVRVDLLTLAGGIIAKAAGADAAIDALYAYYTKTDASATLANSLQNVCDAMNTHNAAYSNQMIIDLTVARQFEGQADTPLPGISVLAGQFVPGLNYIRSFEAKNVD